MVIGLSGVQFGLYEDTKSYYQLIIKITISEKRWIAKVWKKEKIYIQYRSEIDNSQNGCQVTSEKQVVCQS